MRVPAGVSLARLDLRLLARSIADIQGVEPVILPVLAYDDAPRLRIHTSPDGARWFATGKDPVDGAIATRELNETDIWNLRGQLHGSPHWVREA